MVEIKKDPYVLTFTTVVVVVVGALVWHGDVPWKDAAWLLGGMVMPSVFGRQEYETTAEKKP